MCKWYRVAETETAGGHPSQWYTTDGMKFQVAYIRCSGPGDEEMPRRVCAVETHRNDAEIEVKVALRMCDPRYQIVSRVEAGVATSVRDAAAQDE